MSFEQMADLRRKPLRRADGTIPERAETLADVQNILDHVTFAPSCVDMGWEWEIEALYGKYDGTRGRIIGYNVRTTFQRPDTDTGVVGRGHGRWWFIEPGTSRSGVVKTAWLACKQIVEHELMEAFMFEGSRVFNPHADIMDLANLNRREG